ncbi:MAG: lysylphosphatidylglycerol synthase transmembrane domain-containing protein [Microthrixaceae bacterium]
MDRADWRWIVVALIFSALSYPAAAISLAGSIPDPIPFGPNVVAQVASSFVGIVAPAQLGGVALKGRLLQRNGVDPAVAVAGVGLNTVTAFVVHVVMLVTFVWWAGTSDLSRVRLPAASTVAMVLGVAVLLVAVLAALPAGRRLWSTRVRPAIGRAARGMVDVARSPLRLLQLVGGSAMVTVSYAAALAASVEAFHGNLPVAPVAIVYLLGSVVQSVVPTPGGLGAAEAAYIGGLTAIGLTSERAVAAVLLFRLVTFWLPVLPGWLAMTWLQRADAV